MFFALLAWDQAPHWGKKGKTGSNRKNIGKRSERSGSLGREKWPDYRSLGSLPTRRFLFSFFPQCEAWSRAIALLSIQVPIGALSFFLTFFLFPFHFL